MPTKQAQKSLITHEPNSDLFKFDNSWNGVDRFGNGHYSVITYPSQS